MSTKFLYRAEGHQYMLVPHFKITVGKGHLITGADIYSKDGRYLGFWDDFNIPRDVIKQLTKFIQTQYPPTTVVLNGNDKR